jgi:predicted transcriptional regulator
MVRDLMDRLFEGSAGSLVLHALGARKLTAGELAEVKAMLKNLEGK